LIQELERFSKSGAGCQTAGRLGKGTRRGIKGGGVFGAAPSGLRAAGKNGSPIGGVIGGPRWTTFPPYRMTRRRFDPSSSPSASSQGLVFSRRSRRQLSPSGRAISIRALDSRSAQTPEGSYQPAGTPQPNNQEGAPPPVDVYIEDGRGGEYQFQPNHWSCQSIWNRRQNDGGAVHEEPLVGVTNYAYVKIKNRGTQAAANVTVRAFHCRSSAGLTYPDDWQPMTTAQLAAANVPPNSAAEIQVGPFEWVPSQIGHDCMFMVASDASDLSNIDNFTASDSIEKWRLVPNDNNIGQRNVSPVASATGKRLVAGFDRISFHLKNPFRKRTRMTIKAVLPSFLAERNWRIAFANAGVDAFTLEPGSSREVIMRMLPGQDFATDDIGKAKDPVIRVEARADGILEGGMSYPLVTDHKKAAKSTRGSSSATKSRKPVKRPKR
jgi:zinc metalloprotease ZmpB